MLYDFCRSLLLGVIVTVAPVEAVGAVGPFGPFRCVDAVDGPASLEYARTPPPISASSSSAAAAPSSQGSAPPLRDFLPASGVGTIGPPAPTPVVKVFSGSGAGAALICAAQPCIGGEICCAVGGVLT